MRRYVAVVSASLILLPSLAEAHPYSLPRSFALQPEGGAAEPPQPEVDPSLQPTSSKAPPSPVRPEVEKPPEPEPEPEVEPEPEPEPLPEKAPDAFNRHGVGVVGGLTIVPTFIVDNYVATMTNALCRGNSLPGGKLASNLNRVDGCNFFIGGEYIYRVSQVFEVAPQLGYQRIKAPDGLWLDRDECPGGDGSADCNYAAADYTQVDLSFLYVAVDLIGRGTIIKTPEFAWQLGGGGGLGLGIISGIGKGLFQTPLGSPAGSPNGDGTFNGGTCGSFTDFQDFTQCTPHWWSEDSDENGRPPPAFGELRLDDQHANVARFADCTKDKCNEADLDALGRRKNTDVPPVIPYFKLMATTRFLIKDTFGINIQGGWNTGFYFGGSLQYFFGPK
ncbi:MAG: hypothetical protein H6710_06340 [Myxococcales bacterium]|nr:hypothetical protein [Myxococcales bacterium]